MTSPEWDFVNPFIIPITVADDDIDGLGHANNVVYLRWMERVAWAHSTSKGLDLNAYKALDRAMVSRRHEMDYHAPCFVGEELEAATWITENDQRLSIMRQYQICRVSDKKTLLRGVSQWVCVSFSEGKLKRMPTEFIEGYKITTSS